MFLILTLFLFLAAYFQPSYSDSLILPIKERNLLSPNLFATSRVWYASAVCGRQVGTVPLPEQTK